MEYEHTHAPIFGVPIDQGACCVPGPVERSTTYPAADWTYDPYQWSPNRHHIGDYPWPLPHPTYPYPCPTIPAPPSAYIITTTANNAPTLAERPEDTLARAAREIAAAATQLQQSADALGLDLDKRAIRKAVYKRIAEALGD